MMMTRNNILIGWHIWNIWSIPTLRLTMGVIHMRRLKMMKWFENMTMKMTKC